METATAIFACWSAAIWAVLRAVDRTPVGDTATWARILPLMPLALGGLSGPTVVPIAAEHLPWLTAIDTFGAVLLGIGAGAVAASGHATGRQTVMGRDRRITRMGEGAGGKRDIHNQIDITEALDREE